MVTYFGHIGGLRPGLTRVESSSVDIFAFAQAAYSLSFAPNKESVPVCEVRETGGGTTRDFLASELTDGTLEDFVGANDGVISKWYDLTGNGHTLEDIAGENAGPKIVSAGTPNLLAGRPCALFYYTTKAYLDTVAENDIPAGIYDVIFVVDVNQAGCLGNRSRYNTYVWFALPQNRGEGWYAYQGMGTQTYRKNGEDQTWVWRSHLYFGLLSPSIFTARNVENGPYGIGLGRPNPSGNLETSSGIAAMFIVLVSAGMTELIEGEPNGHFGIY